MSGPRVLIIDDEPKLRTVLQMMLQRMGFQVVTAATCPEAWQRLPPMRRMR